MAVADYTGLVESIYIAYFGRPADKFGFTNFAAQLNALNAPTTVNALTAAYATTPAIKTLLDSFGSSAESTALYGTDTIAFVTAIYNNVLNRAPDYDGLMFWASQINAGTLTKGNASLAIMAGAVNNTTVQGVADAQVLANKVLVSTYFTTSITTVAALAAYSGNAAAATARDMLKSVTASTVPATFQTTVDATMAQLSTTSTSVQTIGLTTGQDTLTGTVGNTTFLAPIVNISNTFQSGDTLKGVGTGNTLVADLGNSSTFAILATTTGIQTVSLHAQANAIDSSSNNLSASGLAVAVDAQRMADVTTWVDSASRASLNIESIQLASAAAVTSSLTFVMRDTSPASMSVTQGYVNGTNAAVVASGASFGAYLDPEALRKGATVTSGPVTIEVGSTLSVAQNYQVARPLANMPYTSFSFKDNGATITIPLVNPTGIVAITAAANAIGDALVAKVIADGVALLDPLTGGTQAQMALLIQDAVAAYNSGHTTAYVVTPNVVAFNSSSLSTNGAINANAGTSGYAYTDSAGAPLTTNTYTISLAGRTLTPGTWFAANGLPTSNAFEASQAVTSSSTSSLISTNVVLDHVGLGSPLQDTVYNGATGSAGGNLVIGSMATSGGVQQFDISVQNGSWLNSISSTNNTLQVVNITSSAVASPITSTMTTYTGASSLNQYLEVGETLQNTAALGNNLTGWQTHGLLVATNGLVDVQTVNASGFAGSLMIGETIDAAAITKYLANSYGMVNFSTTLGNNPLGVTVPAANASYATNQAGTTTAGNVASNTQLTASFNSVNLAIDSTVASSGNATFAVMGGKGNDYINLTIYTVAGSTTPAVVDNWVTNQAALSNITIAVGEGNNIVSFNGSGKAAISAGAGNDTIYIDNSGTKAVWVTNASTSTDALGFVSNDATPTAVLGVAGTATVKATETVTWKAFTATSAATSQIIGGVVVTDTSGLAFTPLQVATAAAGTVTAGLTVTNAGTWIASAPLALGATTFTSAAFGTANNTLLVGVQNAPVVTLVNNVYSTNVTAAGTASSTYTGSSESVTVSYNGYKDTVIIGAAGSTSYTSADVNNAIVQAINGDAVMSKMLNATLASGNATVILNSLVDGVAIAPTITFASQATGTQVHTGALGTYATAAADTTALNLQGTASLAATATVATTAVPTIVSTVLTGSNSIAINNSSVTDTGSGATGGTGVAAAANVIDLSSNQSVNNTVSLSGFGTDVIANGNINVVLNIANGSGLQLLGNLLNASFKTETIKMGLGLNGAALALGTHTGAAIASTSVAGTTTMSDAAGVISFAGTATASGATLANSILSLLIADTGAAGVAKPGSEYSYYVVKSVAANAATGALATTDTTYLFHTDTTIAGAVTGSWVQLVGAGSIDATHIIVA